MNIHHLQKMLVTNLVLATKCYRVSRTSHQRLLGTLLQQDMMQNIVVIRAIIPFVARLGCFYED